MGKELHRRIKKAVEYHRSPKALRAVVAAGHEERWTLHKAEPFWGKALRAVVAAGHEQRWTLHKAEPFLDCGGAPPL